MLRSIKDLISTGLKQIKASLLESTAKTNFEPENSFEPEITQNKNLLLVFQGRQGQHVGMGQALYKKEKVFRSMVKMCSDFIGERDGINIVDAFENAEAAAYVQNNEFHSILTQAVLHLSLSELWISKGLKPNATIGLSLGEITSTYINSALSIEEVLTATRSAALWDERLENKGKLLIIESQHSKIEKICQDNFIDLELFAEFGPTTSLYFCLPENVEKASLILSSKKIEFEVYARDYAYHTARFASCHQQMMTELSQLCSKSVKYKFYSAYCSGLIDQSVSFDANYWYWMLAKPVRFNTAFEQAILDGYDVLLNIGPHPALTQYLKEASGKHGKSPLILDSMRNDEPEEVTFERTYKILKELGFIDEQKTPIGEAHNSVDIISNKIDKEKIDLFAPEIIQNPYPTYEKLRSSGSVHFMQNHNFWLVLNYDDVAHSLKQPEIYSSSPAKGLDAVLLGAESEQHTIARQALMPLFSAESIAQLKGFAKSYFLELLELAKKKKHCDIVNDLSIPFTERVIGELLGFSSTTLNDIKKIVSAERYSLNYVGELEEYLIKYLETDESLSDRSFYAQLQNNKFDKKFSKQETASLLKLFWAAGTTTTSMLISSSMRILCQHNAVREQLITDPSLLSQFTEEVLRLESPEQTAWRYTTCDTELAGVSIPRNSNIRLCLAAANRDPKRFTSPQQFVLFRESKDHLALGAGPHYCIGSYLARLENQIAISLLLNHYPNSKLSNIDADFNYSHSHHFRGLSKLSVELG